MVGSEKQFPHQALQLSGAADKAQTPRPGFEICSTWESSTICKEFMYLKGKKYFWNNQSVADSKSTFQLLDSTPDIFYVDQLTVTVRYVSQGRQIQERFLKFLPIMSRLGELPFHSVRTVFQEMNIGVSNCRGQCYDNARNMSGTYKGFQILIQEINPLVVGSELSSFEVTSIVTSINCCLEVNIFVCLFLQSLFNFCSIGTIYQKSWLILHHWQILKSRLD